MTAYHTAIDTGLLILRVVLGLTMAAHGYNKFFGPGGLKGTAGWFDSMGMKPGMFHARVAATTEMSAGLGLAARLLTPIPAAGFVALMLVAAWSVHRPNGFFIVKEGWEYNLILAVSAVAVATMARQLQPGLRVVPLHGFYDYPARLVGSADLGRAGARRRHRAAGDLLAATGKGRGGVVRRMLTPWRESTRFCAVALQPMSLDLKQDVGRGRPRPAAAAHPTRANLLHSARTRSSLMRHGVSQTGHARRRLRGVEQGHPRRADRADGPALGRSRFRYAVVLHLFYVVKIICYILAAWLFA